MTLRHRTDAIRLYLNLDKLPRNSASPLLLARRHSRQAMYPGTLFRGCLAQKYV